MVCGRGRPRSLSWLAAASTDRLSLGFGLKLAKLWFVMALVRILVDGFSLLHNWPELAPGKPRHSAPAREELISRLRQYYDACGTPITIVFDGARTGRD